MYRSVGLVSIAVAGTLVALPAPRTAGAESVSVSGPTSAPVPPKAGQIDKSEPPESAAEEFLDSVEALAKQSGLIDQIVSLVVDPGSTSVHLYVNQGLADLLAGRLDGLSRSFGIRALVVPTAITNAALNQVFDLTAAQISPDVSVTARLSPDRSTYYINVASDLSRDQLRSLATQASAVSPGFPVVVEAAGGQSAIATNSRHLDTSPFWGGAAISDSTAHYMCSTGLRAKLNGTSTYVELIARHCVLDATSTAWYAQYDADVDPPHTGALEGNNSSTTSQYDDAAYLQSAAGTDFHPDIYTGSYLSTTYRSVVTGYTPGMNTTIYLSGGIRGQSTTTVVDDNFDIRFNDHTGTHGDTIIHNGILAKQVGLNDTNGTGDSGSPFYTVHPNGVDAIGRGLMTGITTVNAVGDPLPGADIGDCTQGPVTFQPLVVDSGKIVQGCGNYFVSPGINHLELDLGDGVTVE